MKAFAKANVNAKVKCPFIGYSGINKCDMNATVAPVLPPIVPADQRNYIIILFN